MKKILYLIPLFLLFLIPKVYALPNCNSISNATLYDVYNASSVGAISTNAIKNSTDLLCGNAWWSGATSDNTQGLGWEIQLADLNAKDFYYQLNVYYHIEDVGGGTPSVIASPFRYNNVAVGTSNASILWTSGNLGVTDLSYTINTYSIENGYTYYVVSYIFKATSGFNRVFLPFATSYLYSGSYYLSGIDITNIGSKSLSSTEINSLLANQSSQIQSEINNNFKDTFESCAPSKNIFDITTMVELYGQVRLFDTGWYIETNPNYNGLKVPVEPNTTYSVSTNGPGFYSLAYYYDSNLNYIGGTDFLNDTTFHTPSNCYYITLGVKVGYTWIQIEKGSTVTSYEPYGEVCKNKIDTTNDKLDDVNSSINETNDKLDDLNSSINNSDSSGATDSAGSFFENFEDNDFGLSGIITAPLNTIKTITSNSCTALTLNIPFVNKEMSLPCMTDIYEEHFGSFLDIYQIITFGMISYWVCVQIYAMVKGFKNPDKDEIEVMDL